MSEQWNADRSTLAPEAAPALTQSEIDRRVFDLYDEYCHGRLVIHNNSTPRYHEASAKLAWERTIAFFKKHLA